MRLIDADVAHSLVKQYEESDELWHCTGGTAIRLIHNAIDNTPTVDAVPVVRLETDSAPVVRVTTIVFCKDCKYHREPDKDEQKYLCQGALVCTNADFLYDGWNTVWPDDFCSYGRRRENDGRS